MGGLGKTKDIAGLAAEATEAAAAVEAAGSRLAACSVHNRLDTLGRLEAFVSAPL